MKASERNIEDSENKNKIRERYRGIDPSEIEVIPAKKTNYLELTEKKDSK